MSDSGSTSFPARPLPSGQSQNSPLSSEPNARIIGVPNEVRAELQTRRASLKLEGRVVQQNDDDSIRVRTPRGDIDVRIQDGQPRPERGARVELEIQPSRTDGRNPDRPPEVATIRELPSEAASQRPTSTPVNVEVRPQENAQPLPADVRHSTNANERPAQVQQPLPPEGSVVRLQPVTPRDVQTLPTVKPDILPQVVSTITAPVTFQAQIIAQQATSDIQTQFLNISRSVAASPQPVLTSAANIVIPGAPPAPAALQNIITAEVTVPLPTAAPQQNTQVNFANFIPSVQPTDSAQARLVQNAVVTAPSLSIPAITPPPPIITVAPEATAIPLKAQALNAVIERISPPVSTIAPPNALQIGETQTITLAPKNPILQNQNATSVTGVVTNITTDSLPVLTVFLPQSASTQSFTLQFPSENIAIGTHISFTPQTSATGPTLNATISAQNVPLPVYLTPQPWPVMDDILQTLARAAMPSAQAMVNVTPSPANPAQMGPAMMFFIAAVRGGDLQQWLGQKATDLLKAQKGGGALNRLMGESGTLARVASEPMGQDWRALNIPLFWEGDMNKIALYYKHEREDGDDEGSPLKGTRFVFDLALDHMGKVQLDGLFRPATGQLGRLDLVVRTQEHFSQSTQAEMRRIYAKALRDTQVTGELSFQNQPESWVTINALEDKRFSAQT